MPNEPGISQLPNQSNPDLKRWVEREEPENLEDVAEMWKQQNLNVRQPQDGLEGALLDELEIIHYMLERRIQELENKIKTWREQQTYSGTSRNQGDLEDKIEKAEAQINELQRLLVYADSEGDEN